MDVKRARLITVFGCGGSRDRKKRPLMGAVSSKMSDFTVLTSDNPRSERPEDILAEIETGMAGKNYAVVPDRKEAIRSAIDMARKNDMILIAGKGHEDYQVFADRTVHFSDQETALEILKTMGLT
ncbi:MAG: UDP-N-acetylmuramoyl-L-alanyl-D-glutamate--2,6-diaminopimelate ligase, partial [Candidatus Omnitrophica bacterium]|nr:UDP-N-acetylmuramoyl-L-alanyl-D-glutamate--2,6-diaminopimelate ligase [Candidatus Omnitrophota bacterium]